MPQESCQPRKNTDELTGPQAQETVLLLGSPAQVQDLRGTLLPQAAHGRGPLREGGRTVVGRRATRAGSLLAAEKTVIRTCAFFDLVQFYWEMP